MNYKPAQYPQFFPYLTVTDCETAIEFYTQAFGFEILDSVPGDNGKVQHAELKQGDTVIMMAPEGAWNDSAHKAPATLGMTPSSTFYMYVENVDAFYENAVKNGAKSMQAPEDSFWGYRCCRLQYSKGYEWMFATHKNKSE